MTPSALLRRPLRCCGILLLAGLLATPLRAGSHAPLRQNLPTPRREVAAGALYVDAQRGNDQHLGQADSPLRSINAALTRVEPGQTIYLRSGTYYENVYAACAGSAAAPIVLSSYPGEQAIIDGSLPEFFTHPAAAWEPVENGAPGEYRTTRPYRNLHLVVGAFGDSMIGLQTYYHAADLRAQQQRVHFADLARKQEIDHDPLYCGPGVWYDQTTGHLYARLAHTDLPGVDNYLGETDPRRLPLLIAPFRSTPLTLDGARHLILRDLVIRGGGYDTVKMSLCENVTLDHVTIWAGTYGIRAFAVRQFTMTDSAIYGGIAPWVYRSDGAKRDYPSRPWRNLTRLNTHALLVSDAGREFSVYATPVNDQWVIEHCHFADGHDGLYLGGINARFAHNLVEDLQDDGLYLSQMYPRHLYTKTGATIDVDGNLFRRVNMPFAYGGMEDTRDTIYIHRNIVDNRWPLNVVRPSDQLPAAAPWCGMVTSDHGSPRWPTTRVYHNTFICATNQREAHMRLLTAVVNQPQRQVFNNLLIHLAGVPAYPRDLLPEKGGQADANLFWSPTLTAPQAASYFTAFRQSPVFEQSKQVYPPGFATHSLAADPRFVKLNTDTAADCDYRLQADSPAINAGIVLPADWPDAERQQDAAAPDLGALPLGAPAWTGGPRSVP